MERGVRRARSSTATSCRSSTAPSIAASRCRSAIRPSGCEAPAGFSPSDRDEPFANFFFGGFGNNYVDHHDEKRYREYYALPGAELNEIGGRNFVKSHGRVEPAAVALPAARHAGVLCHLAAAGALRHRADDELRRARRAPPVDQCRRPGRLEARRCCPRSTSRCRSVAAIAVRGRLPRPERGHGVAEDSSMSPAANIVLALLPVSRSCRCCS